MNIRIFVMDCDGVLTDGCTYYSAKGEEMKKFNMKDGQGIALLVQNNIIPAIVTQENSDIVLARAKKLKLQEAHLNVKNKMAKVVELASTRNVSLKNIAYIGDDVNDIAIMKIVGLSFAPADAEEEVKEVAKVVLRRKGGRGAVREAINHVLKG
jgi:YrbI family 3-deoxy-D-manno-octulosonate 8-phosphate phosphatase